MIRIEHLEKKFPDGGTVLKDINALINDGDVVALIGPSGTGKSTLLRCINMLSAPTGGRIFIDDEEITAPGYPIANVHKKVSMVFQSYNLFEHLSVIENVMLPQTTVLKRDKQAAYDKGIELLRSVGMAKKKASFPSALSGGQKQRVAIARTLAMDPEIILFDEPTSALDPSSVDEVKTVIRNVAKSGVTAFIVTHDMELARSIATKIFYMDQGVIYEEGTPEEIFDHPKKALTQQFLKKSKSFVVDITGKDFDYPGLMSDIYAFGLKNNISHSTVNDMQSITEEMVCSLLFYLLDEPFNIHLFYEYDTNTCQADIRFSYDGKALNPMSLNKPDLNVDTADSTIQAVAAVRLLKGLIDKLDYAYVPSEELANSLHITVRKK